jgi:hypothetical protein
MDIETLHSKLLTLQNTLERRLSCDVTMIYNSLWIESGIQEDSEMSHTSVALNLDFDHKLDILFIILFALLLILNVISR